MFLGCERSDKEMGFDNKTTIDKMNLPIIQLEGYMRRFAYPYIINDSFSNFSTLAEIRSEIGEICLRNNKKSIYGIVKVLNNEKPMYLFMLFEKQDERDDTEDDEQYILIDAMMANKLPTKKDFAELHEGVSTAEDIARIDDSTFFYEVANETTTVANSYHRCIENIFVEISYIKKDDVLIVDKVILVDDPSRFVKKLLPIDLKLIT